MEKQRGFVLLIGLLLGVVILVILMNSYSGLFSQYLGKGSDNLPADLKKQQVVLSDEVVVEVKDETSGEVKEVKLGLFPVDVFDYRIKVSQSNYETFAEIMVENVGVGVYKVVKVDKGGSVKAGNILVTVRDFIKTGCPEEGGC